MHPSGAYVSYACRGGPVRVAWLEMKESTSVATPRVTARRGRITQLHILEILDQDLFYSGGGVERPATRLAALAADSSVGEETGA